MPLSRSNNKAEWKQWFDNRSGFTLTEVLIAVMVLVVAIVASANLLVSMLSSNSNNTHFLQAYYYSQEGVEAFRNIRDTHFMHNLDYRGSGSQSLWGVSDGFSGEGTYGVRLNPTAFTSIVSAGNGVNELKNNIPWVLTRVEDQMVTFQENGVGNGQETEFARTCVVSSIESIDDVTEASKKAVKVTCTTTWEFRGSTHEVSLSTILTDWKDV